MVRLLNTTTRATMNSPGDTFSESSSNEAHDAIMDIGVPEPVVTTGKTTKKVAKAKPWYQLRFVYCLGLFLLLSGMLGIFLALFLGTDLLSGKSDNSSSGSTGLGAVTSFPTVAPTEQPTSEPSGIAATARPTEVPSLRPTAPPTAAPSKASPPPTPFPSAPPPESLNLETFSFYVMGDVPYAPWEEEVLKDQMADMSLNRPIGSTFAVHVGDLLKSARTNCAELYFKGVANILLQGPVPTFVMQGDNDSQDCPDPELADDFFHNTFVSHPINAIAFEQQWSQEGRLPSDVEKLSVNRWVKHPDQFAFVKNDILFVSVRIMRVRPIDNAFGKQDKWDARIPDSIEWFTSNLERALNTTQLRGVVIFGHALRDEQTRPFFEGIVPLFVPMRVNIPVLYLHGDGHSWGVDTKFADQTGWSQFSDIQVEQGALADPLLIEVAPVVEDVMLPLTKEKKEHFVFGDGLFRVDRQRGSYD